MKTISMLALLAAVTASCGKKSKPLGDKKTACDHIYSAYRSSQDQKVWTDACMAAPDETVRCVNLIMDEGKDDACMKAVKSPERTKLVTVLNGKPEAAPDPAGSGSAAAAAPAQTGGACPPGAYKPPSGAFCIDAQGFTPSEESKNGSFVSLALHGPSDPSTGSAPEVDISWQVDAPASDYDDRVKVIEDNAKLKGVSIDDQGDMSGVTGKWVTTHHVSGSKDHPLMNRNFASVIKGTKSNFNCESTAGDTIAPAVLTICKSLRPLI
jgi:hypothetical protein